MLRYNGNVNHGFKFTVLGFLDVSYCEVLPFVLMHGCQCYNVLGQHTLLNANNCITK